MLLRHGARWQQIKNIEGNQGDGLQEHGESPAD
jgi:hypothetical protein